jgi:hypothetical protein
VEAKRGGSERASEDSGQGRRGRRWTVFAAPFQGTSRLEAVETGAKSTGRCPASGRWGPGAGGAGGMRAAEGSSSREQQHLDTWGSKMLGLHCPEVQLLRFPRRRSLGSVRSLTAAELGVQRGLRWNLWTQWSSRHGGRLLAGRGRHKMEEGPGQAMALQCCDLQSLAREG